MLIVLSGGGEDLSDDQRSLIKRCKRERREEHDRGEDGECF